MFKHGAEEALEAPMRHEQGGGPDVREGQGGRGEGEMRVRRSQRGQGLEELHLEAWGKKNNIKRPQVLFCVFCEKSKVKKKRKEIDDNGDYGKLT